MRFKYIIGIDEVGRGPLAGPVAVGAVCIYSKHYAKVEKMFPITKDSKKLSAKDREKWNDSIYEAEALGYLSYTVSYISSSVIDKKGLSYAIRAALEKSLKQTKHIVGKTKVLLDGGLHAPVNYLHQETIVKGDEKEISIALASIVAKVARDKKMINLSKIMLLRIVN